MIQLIIDPDITQTDNPKRLVEWFSIQQTMTAPRSPHDRERITRTRFSNDDSREFETRTALPSVSNAKNRFLGAIDITEICSLKKRRIISRIIFNYF